MHEEQRRVESEGTRGTDFCRRHERRQSIYFCQDSVHNNQVSYMIVIDRSQGYRNRPFEFLLVRVIHHLIIVSHLLNPVDDSSIPT